MNLVTAPTGKTDCRPNICRIGLDRAWSWRISSLWSIGYGWWAVLEWLCSTEIAWHLTSRAPGPPRAHGRGTIQRSQQLQLAAPPSTTPPGPWGYTRLGLPRVLQGLFWGCLGCPPSMGQCSFWVSFVRVSVVCDVCVFMLFSLFECLLIKVSQIFALGILLSSCCRLQLFLCRLPKLDETHYNIIIGL